MDAWLDETCTPEKTIKNERQHNGAIERKTAGAVDADVSRRNIGLYRKMPCMCCWSSHQLYSAMGKTHEPKPNISRGNLSS